MKIPPNCQQFFNRAIEDLITNNISISLVNKRYLPGGWAGEFNPDGPILECATGASYKVWFPVFVHEYCHYQQYKEQCPTWVHSEKLGSYDILFEWVKDKKTKLNKKELVAHCRAIKNLEHDCEKRVLKTIKQNNLEIDIQRYTKQANAYVCSYDFVVQQRKFPKRFSREYIDCMPGDRLYKYVRTATQEKLALNCF